MEVVGAGMKPYFEDDSVQIYHGDCRDILPELPSVDLVVADPPYVFGLASTAQEGAAGGWGDLMNSASWFAGWLQQCRTLTAPRQGSVWVFCSWRSFPVLARASFEARWPIISLLVWDKEWIGPGGQQGLRPAFELVALFAHPQFQLANRGLPDIWRSKWSSYKPNGHAAEKPVDLIARIIRETDAEVVLDPFLGSGTTLEAARRLGRKAIGIEIEERWCKVAAKRMSQMVLPLTSVEGGL